MTEKEKMYMGEWHAANTDRELLDERRKAELLCHRFNVAVPGSDEQEKIIKSLLGPQFPEDVTILAPVYFDYGYLTAFGKGSFVNHCCYFMDGGEINIGQNVFIGPFCGFYSIGHPITVSERNKRLERALPITVGDDCWIGANVTILQGVTIGKGCVIAAGSVVTKDIPDNCIAGGVPAVVIKHIEQE